jgi:hypothetical protein
MNLSSFILVVICPRYFEVCQCSCRLVLFVNSDTPPNFTCDDTVYKLMCCKGVIVLTLNEKLFSFIMVVAFDEIMMSSLY